MSQYLTYSELDSAIQERMSGQAPDSTVRLNAIRKAIDDLYAEQDIKTAKRTKRCLIIPDGDPISIAEVTHDSDYKSAKDLVKSDQGDIEYAFPDEEIFLSHIRGGKYLYEFTESSDDGAFYLRVNKEGGATKELLHNMDSLTDNGTWAADTVTSDAANLTTSNIGFGQTPVLSLDILIAQSVNNYALIENSTLDIVDLTDMDNIGISKFMIYLPSASAITSIALRWGNDSSNYFEASATKQVGDMPLVNSWNKIAIDWSDSSETGSVTVASVDYLAIKLTHTGIANQSGIKIEAVNMLLPEAYEFSYYTYFQARKSSDGDVVEDMNDSTNDTLLIERRWRAWVESRALQYCMPISLGNDAENKLARVDIENARIDKSLRRDIGRKPKRAFTKLRIRA